MTAPLSVARLPPRRRRRLGLVVLVVLFALLLLLSNLVPLAAEWLWFQALGYERVFTTRLVAEAVLGVGVGGLVFAFLYVNLRIAQRGLVPNPVVVQYSSGATAVDVTRLLRRLALPTALGLALLFGLGAAGGWLGVLQFLHRTPFGVTDPVFGRDVGYYVFTVPVIAGALGLITTLTTFALVAAIGLYVLRRDVVVFGRRVTVGPSARLHLALLIALLFLLAALRVYFVRLPGLLYSTTGPLVGASFSDLHAALTGLRVAGLAAVAGGALVLWGAKSQRLARNALLALGLYFGVSLLGVALYPAMVQKLIVAPNELVKETPQLASHHGDATGLVAGQRRDARPHRRGPAHRAGHPVQPADHRQRPTVGPRPAPPDVRAAAGDPHLLRLRLGGRRPLLDRWAVPPGAPLAARA